MRIIRISERQTGPFPPIRAEKSILPFLKQSGSGMPNVERFPGWAAQGWTTAVHTSSVSGSQRRKRQSLHLLNFSPALRSGSGQGMV